MKIVINGSEKKRDTIYVFFGCPDGIGKGVWRGEKIPLGSTVHVEFDIENPEIITECSRAEERYAMKIANDVTSLTGDVVDIQDEIICFRFEETITQIDNVFPSVEVGEWITVSVNADHLSIYPMNL